MNVNAASIWQTSERVTARGESTVQNEEWTQEEETATEPSSAHTHHSMWLGGKRPMHEMWSLPETMEPQND